MDVAAPTSAPAPAADKGKGKLGDRQASREEGRLQLVQEEEAEGGASSYLSAISSAAVWRSLCQTASQGSSRQRMAWSSRLRHRAGQAIAAAAVGVLCCPL